VPALSAKRITMSETASGATSEYYQHAQIIQGALIFLSACVAILGHMVQSRLNSAAKAKELKDKHVQYLGELDLKQTRTQIELFLGPAAMLAFQQWNTILSSFYKPFAVRLVQGVESSGVKHETIWGKEADPRAIEYWDKSLQFTFPKFLKGEINLIDSFVGLEIEDEIRSNPDLTMSKRYFKTWRYLVRGTCIPLTKLIKVHAQSLSMFPSSEEFRKSFPSVAKAGFLRNLFYIQYVTWVSEWESILEEWDKGDYTYLRPVQSCFPVQIFPYILSQLTKLREKETRLGAVIHKVENREVENKRNVADVEAKEKAEALRKEKEKADREANEKSQSTNAPDSRGQPSEKGKYVAAGVATGGTLLSALVIDK
jgi:hypothetical protein